MLKNYLITAFRNLIKNKVHSFINIAGLAIGMAVTILIGLWMYDELSFDKNFSNYNTLGRVIQNVTNNGEVQTWKSVPYPLSDELRRNYGHNFKHIAMGVDIGDHMLAYNDKKLNKQGGFFEKEMPAMLTLQMLNGSSSLSDPSSVLISASAAKAYFNNDDPVNKVLRIGDQVDVKVTGVYKDFPCNSSFADLDFIATWDLYYNQPDGPKNMSDPWRPNFVDLYVQLNDNANIASVNAGIRDAKLKKVNPQLQKKKPALFIEPMSKWHLYAEYKNGVNTGGAIQYVWMFGIIGVFVLLLACINFMNLSTARSEKRAKEVGIRKTVGSLRSQLILQFFNESLLTVLFALALSVLMVQCALPFFNNVSGKQMALPWGNVYFWLLCLVFAILTAVVSGSYPAFYLSSFKPVKVLKGTFKAGRLAAVPRKVLVVLQFSISVSLIIATIVVYRQIQFAKNRPVGYSREGLVFVPVITPAIHKHFDAVKSELLQSGTVASITEAGSPTTGINGSTSGISWQGKDPNLSVDFNTSWGSYDYGKTVGWTIKEGRDFSRDFSSDSAAVILNEAAVSFMQLKKPVGQNITWFGTPYKVVGVVDNMVMQSPYEDARPTVYSLDTSGGYAVLIRIMPGAAAAKAVDNIATTFKKFNPEQPFEYHFINEEYAKKFSDEERVGKLASFFATLAVIISCLGLFGLVSFVAEQRTKEIGVRKILGASTLTLWGLLSREFVVLVSISFFVAVPVSYYFMHGWLQHYTYRAALSWWIFAGAGAGALLITLVTVSFRAIKAAVANPVKSLRTE
ncbi:MAG TPA: ABC transporter permease [Chitinophagaceae bacterium]|nr:ABC transporter permease [Chitinophagaceae bacterium]